MSKLLSRLESSRIAKNMTPITEEPSCLGTATLGPSAYQQLDLRNRQIRIIRLLHGGLNDQIRCSLYTAYLDDRPFYEALSYVWGDSQVCQTIIVDGKVTDVTTNLWYALRRLRRRFSDRHIWVDALCINQEDKTEKSHQVNLMK